jgi:hypothetical protein
VDTRDGLAYAGAVSVVRADQGGTTMKRLASVLVLLSLVGVGRAGEKDIRECLERAGVRWGSFLILDTRESYEALDFGGVHGTDSLLGELCELKQVPGLQFLGSDVTDAGMASVGGLRGLMFLDLYTTAITDTGIRHLKGLSGLTWLSLCTCPITDAGLVPLTRLSKLKQLHLDRTAISDDGLRHLEKLGELKILGLTNCPNVTDAGVARLQKALPNCKIQR